MKKETKENLELLLKDLCGRLPYNVIGRRKWIAPMTKSPEQTNQALSPRDLEAIQSLIEHGLAYVNLSDGREIFLDKYEFTPYLRPMSSMMEEEKKVYYEISHHLCGEITAKTMIDFLHAHHFDYRGLIDMGLALEAPEGMYNY